MNILTNEISYKGHKGSISFNYEKNKFYGKILNIKESFIYEAYTISELIEKFKKKVEIYLRKK